MGLIIGQGSKSGGGGGGASAADKALAQATTLDGRLYNLWEVMPKVKADPRVSGYAVIMLAEYLQGYTSITLYGANAYLTCDGAFYTTSSLTEDIVHHWHDHNSVYMDRWVAYLFTLPNTKYTPKNAEVIPRNMLVDGELGAIDFVRLSVRCNSFLTTEGSSIAAILETEANATTQVGNVYYGRILSLPKDKVCVPNINCDNIVLGLENALGNTFQNVKSVKNIYLPELQSVGGNSYVVYAYSGAMVIDNSIVAPKLKSVGRFFGMNTAITTTLSTLKKIECPSLVYSGQFCVSAASVANIAPNLIHIEIGQGYYADLYMRQFGFANCLLTDSNYLVEDVVAHPTWSNLDQWLWNFEHLIVDKLLDLSGQTAKTITLAAAPYAAITESIRAKMSAKNWNLASA